MTGIIHGDFNEQNIICRESKETGQEEIFSVIDFGDSQWNPLLYELGIAIMYMMTRCDCMEPSAAGGHVVAGYIQVRFNIIIRGSTSVWSKTLNWSI